LGSSRPHHAWLDSGGLDASGRAPWQNTAPEAESIAEPWDNMTAARTHQLLRTNTASTREQIHSAYRHMVTGQSHERERYLSSFGIRVDTGL
jgi:hypothetical protein